MDFVLPPPPIPHLYFSGLMSSRLVLRRECPDVNVRDAERRYRTRGDQHQTDSSWTYTTSRRVGEAYLFDRGREGGVS